MKTLDAARGKWRGILLTLGIDEAHLHNRHGPCPLCGGVDRFRWDNKNGNGSYICNACGAGTGMQLLQNFKGWDFKTAAGAVDRVLGNVEAEAIPQAMPEADRRALLNRVWLSGRPLEAGDLAHTYLAGRVPMPKASLRDIRFSGACMAPDGVSRPAMLALVRGLDGKPVNLHRTFLGAQGKADMDNPRAMMPGRVPEGSAIRLFHTHGERLGIAEGIETALAAAARFGLPVWSAINTTILAKWMPPANVKEVWIFGDADAKFGGQAAAYALAHKLAARHGIAVQVHIPDSLGQDWADKVA
jgi:putative DNA primase/helicase